MDDETLAPPKHPWLPTAAVCISWLLLGGVALASIALLDLSLNFLSWRPSLRQAHQPLGIYFLSLAGAWWLSGRTHGRVRVAAAVLVGLVLAAFGGSFLQPERPGILRAAPSPMWYRGGRLVLLLLPGATLALRRSMSRWLGWPDGLAGPRSAARPAGR